MIIPYGAPPSYVEGLKEAIARYSNVERTPEEVTAFCEGFRLGWESSKHATFQILERIGEEQDD